MPDFLSKTFDFSIPEVDITTVNGALRIAEEQDYRIMPEVDYPKRKHEDATEERHKDRIARCGIHSGRTLGSDGLPRSVPFRCNIWRSPFDCRCEYCFAKRVELMKLKIMNVYQNTNPLTGQVGFVEVPRALGESITGPLPKNKYWKVPVGDEENVLDFLVMETSRLKGIPGVTVLTRNEVNTINYERLAATPGTHRTSGTLGQPTVKATKKLREVIIHIDHNLISVEDDTSAYLKAIRHTIDLNPKTDDEYEYAFKERMGQYIKEINRINPKAITSISWRWRAVDLSCIDWSKHTQVKSSWELEVALRVAAIPRKSVIN